MIEIRYVILIENTGASPNLSHLCKGGKRKLTQREHGLVWVWEDCWRDRQSVLLPHQITWGNTESRP